MKKTLIMLAAAGFIFTSCGSSTFESDVRKMARYQCELQKLQAKEGDPKTDAEIEKLEKESKEYEDKMETKYKDMENDTKKQAEALKIMMDEMAKCK